MITISKYEKKQLDEWDQFINASNNGTMFQKQRFINYHIDRKFVDNSLIIKNTNNIVALLPAAIKNNILYSHPGSSYGGLVLAKKTEFSVINNIIQELDNYCKNKKLKSIFLINSPSIYHKEVDDSLDYLLQWNHFRKKEIYISHAVNINETVSVLDLLKKRKRRYLNNDDGLNALEFKESNEFDLFYDILLKSKEKFKTKPTHSLEELYQLKKIFPEQIKLLLTMKKDSVVGGSLMFFANKKISLIFYNTILEELRNSQISMLQLYKCMEISKQLGYQMVDFGVSHTPEANDPMAPKLSLIHFKEQFNARGVLRVAYQKDYCE